MEYKPLVIQLFEQSHQAEQDLAAHLPEQERQATGELKNWAFKEYIAHLTIWKKRQMENFQANKNGQPINRYDNYLELNDQNFVEFSQMTWPEIEQFSAQVQQAYIAMLQSMSEKDLLDTLPEQQRPVWYRAIGTVIHAFMHLGEIYARHGKIDLANQLQEKAAQSLAALDPSDDWKGTLRYNLACHYALTGQTKKALGSLREALALNPGLTEWSKQDTDLDSLRQDPEYQALYK